MCVYVCVCSSYWVAPFHWVRARGPLCQVFTEMDQDGDQSMDLDEFVSNRHMLGLKTLNLEQAKELFKVIDEDGSGKVRTPR